MDNSSLLFITCDQLREEFHKCEADVNKRILIIDVRNVISYNKCHLQLDFRNLQKSSIKRKMRVMNIDPNRMKLCTAKNMMSVLSPDDLTVFNKRRDATDVVVIDCDTDDISELSHPKSKVMQIINGLTRFDNQTESKIEVPVKILKGGFREWVLKYPHFTTEPTYNPDSLVSELENLPSPPRVEPPPSTRQISPTAPPLDLNDHALKQSIAENAPAASKELLDHFVPSPNAPKPQPSRPSTTSKPVPVPPRPAPTTPKPTITKNAPGTAVPVTPISFMRPTLPRSHSSPNVAQQDGDELDNPLQHLDQMALSKNGFAESTNQHSNHVNSSTLMPAKPRFDRALKPTYKNEAVNVIRAQLNFGRSPEASGKAISGLQNLGNTCFMNSVIQCLNYSPSLVTYFSSDSYYNHINFNSQYGSKGELAIEFGALIEKLSSQKHRYVEPKSFRDSVTKHIGFVGNEQQDSHEFMMMLFDKLHHDLNIHAKDTFKQNGLNNGTSNNDDSNINIPRATLGYQFWKRHLELNKSIISDLFEGIFMSTLTCTFCRGQSNTFEVFNCLSLPIPSESRCHVKDCLSHFSNPERIDAAWECPRCKMKREAEKKIVICKLPKILIIHLKRFSLDGRWRQKLQTTVDFPLSDLTVDCTNVLPQSAYGPPPIRNSYNLYAVVNHYGHLDGGHYTAFCKMDNHRWHTFDDSNVSEMKDSDVCTQAAYILFYGANH